MILKANGTTYTVHLWYQPDPTAGLRARTAFRHALCCIHEGPCVDKQPMPTDASWPTFCRPRGVRTGEGLARCQPTDNFEKAVARKLTFGRAALMLYPKLVLIERQWGAHPDAAWNRERRRGLWNAFLEKVGRRVEPVYTADGGDRDERLRTTD